MKISPYRISKRNKSYKPIILQAIRLETPSVPRMLVTKVNPPSEIPSSFTVVVEGQKEPHQAVPEAEERPDPADRQDQEPAETMEAALPACFPAASQNPPILPKQV